MFSQAARPCSGIFTLPPRTDKFMVLVTRYLFDFKNLPLSLEIKNTSALHFLVLIDCLLGLCTVLYQYGIVSGQCFITCCKANCIFWSSR